MTFFSLLERKRIFIGLSHGTLYLLFIPHSPIKAFSNYDSFSHDVYLFFRFGVIPSDGVIRGGPPPSPSPLDATLAFSRPSAAVRSGYSCLNGRPRSEPCCKLRFEFP